MGEFKRIIVEKKDGFNVEAEQVRRDLVNTLGITALKSLRIFNIYDVEGLNGEELEKGKTLVFSEPPADDCYEEELPLYEGERAFGFMYLPGQYDQRADSASLCLEIISGHRVDALRCCRVWAMKGDDLTDADVEKIKSFAINPVDSTEIPLEKPASIRTDAPPPEPVAEIEGFLTMDDDSFKALYESLS